MIPALNSAEPDSFSLTSPTGATKGAAGPKYEQLRHQIIDQIASGRLKPGEALPTERAVGRAQTGREARSAARWRVTRAGRDDSSRAGGKARSFTSRARDRSHRGLAFSRLSFPKRRPGFIPRCNRVSTRRRAAVHHQLLVCNTANSVDRQGNIILQLLDKRVAGVAPVPVTLPLTPAYQVRQLQKAASPWCVVTVASRGSVRSARDPVWGNRATGGGAP